MNPQQIIRKLKEKFKELWKKILVRIFIAGIIRLMIMKNAPNSQARGKVK